MPGDDWQRFANLRAAFAMMWAHPGKKLLFMGGEFGQWNEWNAQSSLDWHLLDDGPLAPLHRGVQRLVRDLNNVLRAFPALHQQDHVPAGFRWLDADDAEHSVYTFVRWSKDGQAVVVACNFTPVPREGYRIGMPQAGAWRELINSDLGIYGGSGVSSGRVEADGAAWQQQAHSAFVTLPPLAVVMWVRDA
jgi:1,4-alpha-glucan branching enzyme